MERKRNGSAVFKTSNEQLSSYCLKGIGLHPSIQACSYFHQSCRTQAKMLLGKQAKICWHSGF